jgi:hypothetical protein
MVGYYPEGFNIPKILRQYKELEMVDDMEEERLIDVMERRKRGKGAPKKAKSKGAYAGLALCFTVRKQNADVVLFFAGVFYVSRGEQKVDQEAMMSLSTVYYGTPEERKGTAMYLTITSHLHSVFSARQAAILSILIPTFLSWKESFSLSSPPNLHPICEILAHYSDTWPMKKETILTQISFSFVYGVRRLHFT